MSVVIFSASKSSQGIERFIQKVRMAGNNCVYNPSTLSFDVYTRDISLYDADVSTKFMAEQEIGELIEEFEDTQKENANTDSEAPEPDTLNVSEEKAAEEKRATSLADILKSRQNTPLSIDEDLEGEDKLVKAVEEVEKEDARNEGHDYIDDSDGINPDIEQEGDFTFDHSDTAGEPEAGLSDLEELDAKDHNSFDALRSAAHKISEIKKKRILDVVQDMLGTDIVDDSEILLMLAETGDIKKALSALLAKLSVKVSITAVSRDYKTQTQVIPFASDRVESLQTYRMGVMQALTRIDVLLAGQENLEALEAEVKALQNNLDSERRTSQAQVSDLRQQMEKAVSLATPKPFMPAKFQIIWKAEDTVIHYLTVAEGSGRANKDANDPTEYPTKSLGASPLQGKGFRFLSIESAQAQVKRMNKFMSNLRQSIPSLPERPEFLIVRIGLDIVA